jgi:catechol 2,3-dioxygenase-like lactoylglutathione lyase family enzyme
VLDLHDATVAFRIAAARSGLVIGRLDHLVLTTRQRESCIDFYTRVLGMRLDTFGQGRVAFRFGDQKINLHEAGRELEPKAVRPTPGGLDLCFLADEPLDAVVRRLAAAGVRIELGPVPRTGATGPIRSVYVRDPDGNLVEIAEPLRTPEETVDS